MMGKFDNPDQSMSIVFTIILNVNKKKDYPYIQTVKISSVFTTLTVITFKGKHFILFYF